MHFVRGTFETTVISYTVSAAVLAIPFYNAIGADVKNIASIATISWYNVSLTSIAILFAWLLAGFLGSVERHTNPLLTVIHALGIPGIVLGLLAIVGAT